MDYYAVLLERMKRKLPRPGSELVKLKIGTIYCDDYEPTHLHVVVAIWEYLKIHAKGGSTIYMFRQGPIGLIKSEYEELITYSSLHVTPGLVSDYGRRGRFETPGQFQKAEKTVRDLQLDGLVFIGGDDATLNAYLLDKDFREKKVNTSVIFCPSTLKSDNIYTNLNCNETPCRLGFDNVCKAYSIVVEKIMKDARSRGECYHFVRLSGHAASQITLECALQTHPNIALIGDELSAKKLTLKDVRDQIVDVICKRSELGYNYGVILIPEGLIYFIPEIRKLFAELNKIFSIRPCVIGHWMEKLTTQSIELFNILPQKTRDVVKLRSNPRGFPLIPEIDTEWTLIEVVKTELEKKKNKGPYKGEFKGIPQYIGCMKPKYDCCYKQGFSVSEIIRSGKTGLMPSVENLSEPYDKWTVSWTPLSSLVDCRNRNGKLKHVIKKPSVELDGVTFQTFEVERHIWAIEK